MPTMTDCDSLCDLFDCCIDYLTYYSYLTIPLMSADGRSVVVVALLAVLTPLGKEPLVKRDAELGCIDQAAL